MINSSDNQDTSPIHRRTKLKPSHSITAFKEPRSRNAGITLIWMAFILGVLFIGISYVTTEIQAVPSEAETVIVATTIILILAANTAFAGFPRLSAMLAQDGFMPRQLTYRGSRLVYSYGIVALAGMACVLIVLFQASVTRLIPLYAIGVFLSFTLAQAGMARRWWRSGKISPANASEAGKPQARHELHYEKNWLIKMISNGFGDLCTAIHISTDRMIRKRSVANGKFGDEERASSLSILPTVSSSSRSWITSRKSWPTARPMKRSPSWCRIRFPACASITCCTCRPPRCCARNCFPHQVLLSLKSPIKSLKWTQFSVC